MMPFEYKMAAVFTIVAFYVHLVFIIYLWYKEEKGPQQEIVELRA